MVWLAENSLTNTTTTGDLWASSTSTTANRTVSTGEISWNQWTNSTTASTTASTWDLWTSSSVTSTSTGIASTWTAWTATAPVARPARRPRIESQARNRADKLLVEHLSAEQEQSLAEHGYFDVDSFVEGEARRFRIHNHKYQHNVFEIDENGRKLRELCAHTSHACPQSDHALAQKLMLEHNPAEFLRVANIWDLSCGMRDLVSRAAA